MLFLDAIFLEKRLIRCYFDCDAIAIPDQHKQQAFTYLLTRGITCVVL